MSFIFDHALDQDKCGKETLFYLIHKKHKILQTLTRPQVKRQFERLLVQIGKT